MPHEPQRTAGSGQYEGCDPVNLMQIKQPGTEAVTALAQKGLLNNTWEVGYSISNA